jgi:hypothetical protein
MRLAVLYESRVRGTKSVEGRASRIARKSVRLCAASHFPIKVVHSWLAAAKLSAVATDKRVATMDTVRLRQIPQPSPADALLHGWVESLGVLPREAHAIREHGELPDPLRRIARMAMHIGRSWSCWADANQQLWLFVADISPLLSRERGASVLQVDQYREDGELKDSGTWTSAPDGTWRRCAH